MRPSISAARFLVASVAPTARASRVAGRLRVAGEPLRAWVYAPLADVTRSPLVLALHGLSARGLDDPRMDTVCRALAAAGCRVLAPELPDTARLRVGTADRERIAALLDPLDGEPPVGVFAASFSASMALGAVAHTPAGVRAVCAVGACGDVVSIAHHLLAAPDADPYGRVLLFRNFGGQVAGWTPAVAGALDLWLAEDPLGARRPRFSAARAALGTDEGALVDAVVAGDARAAAGAPTVLERAGPTLAALDVTTVAHRIRAHVTLLHGADDRVIPCGESVALAARIRDAHLCVTPLLTHGDTRLGRGTAREAPRLFRAFHDWFSALNHA